MNEPCRLRRGEQYEVCEDALKGLGCCPARKTQFFASRPLDAQLAKYEIDLFVRWQAARGMAIAAHCLPSTRHYSGVIYPPLSVLTQLFFLRIIKAQDDNDTDADALDRVSASCIFGNERKRCRQKSLRHRRHHRNQPQSSKEVLLGRRKKIINNSSIPQHEIEKIARCIWPDILAFYQSEDGQREFAEWKRQKEALKEKPKDTQDN